MTQRAGGELSNSQERMVGEERIRRNEIQTESPNGSSQCITKTEKSLLLSKVPGRPKASEHVGSLHRRRRAALFRVYIKYIPEKRPELEAGCTRSADDFPLE